MKKRKRARQARPTLMPEKVQSTERPAQEEASPEADVAGGARGAVIGGLLGGPGGAAIGGVLGLIGGELGDEKKSGW